MENQKFDIAILGGGPGGYVAAIRAAQLGFKTAIVEKERLGGICLNWGCIPTKALLKSAELYDTMKNDANTFGLKLKELEFDFSKIIKRSRNVSAKVSRGVEYLMRKNKITYFSGFGKFLDKNHLEIKSENKTETIEAKNIVISTGAQPKKLPFIPVDEKVIITSRTAMVMDKVPESIVIIGGGAIGLEFAYFFNVFGAKVTIVEMLQKLAPNEDEEISDQLEKSFRKRGIRVLTSTRVESAKVENNNAVVIVSNSDGKEELKASVALNAIGVTGNLYGFGIENIGVKTNGGFIEVNKPDYRTNVENIFAIGDVIGAPLLAHVASAEGIACVENIAGLNSSVNYSSIPACTYTQPQIASIGLTEKEAIESGFKIRIGKFPYSASGKAAAIGEREGFVKLIFNDEYGELLGAHIIGAEATEMIAEMSLAKTLEGDFNSIFKTIHAHPTLSEMIMEAAADANNESIHI